MFSCTDFIVPWSKASTMLVHLVDEAKKSKLVNTFGCKLSGPGMGTCIVPPRNVGGGAKSKNNGKLAFPILTPPNREICKDPALAETGMRVSKVPLGLSSLEENV